MWKEHETSQNTMVHNEREEWHLVWGNNICSGGLSGRRRAPSPERGTAEIFSSLRRLGRSDTANAKLMWFFLFNFYYFSPVPERGIKLLLSLWFNCRSVTAVERVYGLWLVADQTRLVYRVSHDSIERVWPLRSHKQETEYLGNMSVKRPLHMAAILDLHWSKQRVSKLDYYSDKIP